MGRALPGPVSTAARLPSWSRMPFKISKEQLRSAAGQQQAYNPESMFAKPPMAQLLMQ